MFDGKERIEQTDQPLLTLKKTMTKEIEISKKVPVETKQKVLKLQNITPIQTTNTTEKTKLDVNKNTLYGLFGVVLASSTYFLLKEQ